MKRRQGSFPVLLVLAGCSTPGTVYQEAERPLGPYSGAVLSGDFCFVSGKIGERGGSFEREASTAIAAVEQELARAGLTLADVVQVTVYLTDIGNYHDFIDVYASRFDRPYPARAVVQVGGLPGQARVEIQAVARQPK